MVDLPCARCVGRDLNICRPLDGERLAHLLSFGGPRRWSKRDVLFRAGDPMGPFFKIRKGVAAVSRTLGDGRRQIVALRVPGECLGYLAEGGRYVFDGHAVTDVEACAFDRRQYDAYAARHPDLAVATAGALAAALKQASETMAVLGRLRSTARVAHFLVEIDELYRQGHVGQNHVPRMPMALLMSRTEIGNYLGLTIETVSRAFGKLRDRGLIRVIDGEQVAIVDGAKLRELGRA
jgi:CRP/FNR family transcriptional regulator